MYWGKNKGCSFYKYQCGTTDEFCSDKNDMSCSEDYTFKMYCKKGSMSDACYINEYDSDFNCENKLSGYKNFSFEKFGVYSRCFEVES